MPQNSGRRAQTPEGRLGVKLRSHGSEMARPVYVQQRTYLMSVATAVECQKQSFDHLVIERETQELECICAAAKRNGRLTSARK
jgi:hypothetical protein